MDLYRQRIIQMEDISDGINFIAIHEFRTSLILFWILNFMGRDECNVHRLFLGGSAIVCMDGWMDDVRSVDKQMDNS